MRKPYETVFCRTYTEKIQNSNESFYELLIHTCDEIVKSDKCELEDKIILSIAIRLKAEEFMCSKVNINADITKKQTYELFESFKEDYKNEKKNIKTLEQVVLMTPENIHLNSFMYEPILDMGIDALKELYKEIPEI